MSKVQRNAPDDAFPTKSEDHGIEELKSGQVGGKENSENRPKATWNAPNVSAKGRDRSMALDHDSFAAANRSKRRS